MGEVRLLTHCYQKGQAYNDANDDAVADKVIAELHRVRLAAGAFGCSQQGTRTGVCDSTTAPCAALRSCLQLVTPAKTDTSNDEQQKAAKSA